MTSRSHRVVGALVALAICTALPVSQLAIARSVTVICCCGPHDVEHACGCDTCPALASDDDSPRSEGASLRLVSCDTDAPRLSLPTSPAVVLPAPPALAPGWTPTWPLPALDDHVRTRALTPPTPDG